MKHTECALAYSKIFRKVERRESNMEVMAGSFAANWSIQHLVEWRQSVTLLSSVCLHSGSATEEPPKNQKPTVVDEVRTLEHRLHQKFDSKPILSSTKLRDLKFYLSILAKESFVQHDLVIAARLQSCGCTGVCC
jgi:hypothetical protein